MKPIAFDYARPATVEEAVRLLASVADTKVLAGGQTLGPMLNLRLAQPSLLVDITRIAELASVQESADAVTIGATVTHASIEDGRVSDPAGGFLSRVARGIAYRAVRTRGTIGGSLSHADPAADWLSALTALGADLVIFGSGGNRNVPLTGFVRSAMETELGPEELIVGVRIPKFSRRARFGFHKVCRKTGEFAEAIGVAVHDSEKGVSRLVVSTSAGKPIVLAGERVGLDWAASRIPDAAVVRRHLADARFSGDAYELAVHAAALRRAIADAIST